MGNTYFEHMSFHKYTRMTRGKYGVEVKIMKILVLVKKDMIYLCTGYEANERNGTRPLRSSCCTV